MTNNFTIILSRIVLHNICTNKSSKLINLKISILFLKLTKLTSLENKIEDVSLTNNLVNVLSLKPRYFHFHASSTNRRGVELAGGDGNENENEVYPYAYPGCIFLDEPPRMFPSHPLLSPPRAKGHLSMQNSSTSKGRMRISQHCFPFRLPRNWLKKYAMFKLHGRFPSFSRADEEFRLFSRSWFVRPLINPFEISFFSINKFLSKQLVWGDFSRSERVKVYRWTKMER